jgi:hypothetical protein
MVSSFNGHLKKGTASDGHAANCIAEGKRWHQAYGKYVLNNERPPEFKIKPVCLMSSKVLLKNQTLACSTGIIGRMEALVVSATE